MSELPAGARLMDYSLAGQTYRVMAEAVTESGSYRAGYIMTPFGVVGVYDQWSAPHTSLSMSINGRCYSAWWDRTFRDRFLKTLAKRFAAQVAREAGIA